MPAFVWTFDDGYDELHQDVLPYLTPLGQRATVYLTSSFGGRHDDPEPRAPPRPLCGGLGARQPRDVP